MKTSIINRTMIMLSLVFSSSALFAQNAEIDNFRAYDKTGLNVFETPKTSSEFNGLRWRMGFSFVQPLQMLDHSSKSTTDLKEIGTDFNTAVANWNVDAQLAQGVRLNVVTYLSSRHHQETWVKGGFIQFDELPFLPMLNGLMEFTTIRVGHFQINYGDAQFRRSDNGLVSYNPFIENFIMDAFTTEIGGEVLVRHSGFLGLVGITNGEIKGDVTSPKAKAPAFYLKGGYDSQLNDDLRVRVTASMYTTDKSANNTLYDGDRGGSHYYYVVENTAAGSTSPFTSGRMNPGLDSKVFAFVINPFVKFGGLEIFGNYEMASGTRKNEETASTVPATRDLDLEEREWTQLAGDVVYRFGEMENFWVGARYNTVSGRLYGYTEDVSTTRMALSGGWFMTDAIMAKVEYVTQTYDDKFNVTDTRHDAEFSGIMLEASVSF